MASSDTKSSGFRLPWSNDRSNDPAPEAPVDGAEDSHEPVADSVAWPDSDLHARLGVSANEQRPADPVASSSAQPEESQAMVETEAPAPALATPKKPSKLMADLSAAIRATAEQARDQALLQLDADARQVTDAIRERSTEGGATLRKRSEDDIAGIRDWSKAEIARIREETDSRISERKADLEHELAAHATAVDNRVEEVQAEADRFRNEMGAYFERLGSEDDPARLATMVEAMPEPPSFDFWADIEFVAPPADTARTWDAPKAPVDAEPAAGADDTAAEAEETAWTGEAVATEAEAGAVETAEDAATGRLDTGEAAPIETIGEAEMVDAADVVEPEVETPGEAEVPVEDAAATATPWGEDAGDWSTGAAPAEDDVPRWEAGEAPEGFPTGGDEAGHPVDRGAIMAALEAAAEAVVAAEAAADSADQAEAAADVAETAAELLVGRHENEDEAPDPEAQAALAARMDAGGLEESYADRLASLVPSDAPAGDETRTTQVIVSGLVSVASIASFKRHLGRLPGVQGVAVASGPEGEFMFNVTHRADVSFKDSIPTMPGFAARVTSMGNGVVNVTARDPETEG